MTLTNITPNTDDFGAYMSAIRQIPQLSAEEEYELAVKYKEYNDLNAAHTLIISNLRFVVHVAKQYSKFKFPLLDLIQEGNIGLMKAVSKFDPYVGVRLVTYAAHWIKTNIIEYTMRNRCMVKSITTKAHRKVFFNIFKYIDNFQQVTPAIINNMINDLNVTKQDIYEVIERLSCSDISIDAPEESDYGYDEYYPLVNLESNSRDPAECLDELQGIENQHALLYKALEQLDEKSLDIITNRRLSTNPMTLTELGERYGVSYESIRQTEIRAFKKIKEYMGTEYVQI